MQLFELLEFISSGYRRVLLHGQIQRGGEQGVWTTPGKAQVAIGLLINTDTDPPQEAIGPIGSNWFLREVRMALCEIRWWLTKRCQHPHPVPQKNFLDPPIYSKILTLNGRITYYICCILKVHNVIKSFLHKIVNAFVLKKVVHLPTVDASIGIRTLTSFEKVPLISKLSFFFH